MGTAFVKALVFAACLFGALLPAGHAESMDSENRRGKALFDDGLHQRAIAAYERAIEIGTREGASNANIQRVKQNLARACLAESQFARADELFRESFTGLLEDWRAGRGQVTVDEPATVLQNWAGYFYALGRYPEAEAKTREAMQIYEQAGMTDSASATQNNLAALYGGSGRHEEALREYDAILKYREERFGTNDTRFGNVLGNKGTEYFALKDFENALGCYERSMEIFEGKFGRGKNPDMMANIGMALEELGRFDEAQRYFERYLDLAENHYGKPDLASTARGKLATIAAYQGRWKEAWEYADASQRATIPSLKRIAMGLSDSEQLSYLPIYLGKFVDDAVSIAWALHLEKGAAEKMAAWSMNARGLLYELMSERLLIERDSRLSGNGALFEELVAVRRQIAALLQAGYGDGSKDEYVANVVSLQDREASLSRKAGLTAEPGGRLGKYVELPELRASLTPDTLLVHVARVSLRNFQSRGGPHGLERSSRYVAWIIPPAGKEDVSMVDLGDVESIDAAVSKMKSNFASVEKARSDLGVAINELAKEKLSSDEHNRRVAELIGGLRATEAVLEKELRESAALDISRLLLHPLLDAGAPYEKWILCPDSNLWLIPWGALVLPDGRYLLEAHELSQVVTPREIPRNPGRDNARPQSGSLVVSSPNYDLGVTDASASTGFAPLIHGFGEDWIKTWIGEFAKFGRGSPTVLVGDQASEEAMKSLRGPEGLVLVTHGMFGEMDQTRMPPGHGYLKESPLVRSVLTFAGCNKPRTGLEPGEDGILLGSEVLACDLRGTRLVVLTACQTAQGDTNAGQAAAGMRQAFLLAGAAEVVATLWSIDQAASKELVNDLMTGLGTGKRPAEALRVAQLNRRKSDDYCHPFYWAAFTITGHGR
jgi:tetratricopeptide (TPR) repeat protein